MKARAPLALTPADPQPQPHPARQGHHIPAILVAQPHVSAAPRAVLPGRHQDPLPLRPPSCRHPSHLAPPGVTDHCSYQRITPAAFAGLEKTGRNPTDRGKRGVKRLVLTDGRGVPLGATIDGANRNDHKLMRETRETIPIERPKPTWRRP